MENNNCTTVETIANTSLANIHLQEDKPSQKNNTFIHLYTNIKFTATNISTGYFAYIKTQILAPLAEANVIKWQLHP